jgi:hypothetical protein
MESNEILPTPELPIEIKNAVNNSNLAVFIGAGVSRLIGCKGWDELAKTLVERCFTEFKPDNTRLVSYKEKEFLLLENNPKKVITICQDILETNQKENVYIDELQNALMFKNPPSELNIYNEIYKLRGLFKRNSLKRRIEFVIYICNKELNS